jgi:hypothetical protein
VTNYYGIFIDSKTENIKQSYEYYEEEIAWKKLHSIQKIYKQSQCKAESTLTKQSARKLNNTNKY